VIRIKPRSWGARKKKKKERKGARPPTITQSPAPNADGNFQGGREEKEGRYGCRCIRVASFAISDLGGVGGKQIRRGGKGKEPRAFLHLCPRHPSEAVLSSLRGKGKEGPMKHRLLYLACGGGVGGEQVWGEKKKERCCA